MYLLTMGWFVAHRSLAMTRGWESGSPETATTFTALRLMYDGRISHCQKSILSDASFDVIRSFPSCSLILPSDKSSAEFWQKWSHQSIVARNTLNAEGNQAHQEPPR